MASKLANFASRLKHTLREHYSAPLESVFSQFRIGAIIFAVGLIIILYSHQSLSPSIQQELVVLAGLVLTIIGFIVAMLAQIRLVIGRVFQFFSRKK